MEDEEEDVDDELSGVVCELCKGGHMEDQILLCDRCDLGFHLFCLSPPLSAVPEGEWVCPLCKKADSDSYAFREGERTTLPEFEQQAQAFKLKYWGSEAKAKRVCSILISLNSGRVCSISSGLSIFICLRFQ